MRMSPPLSPLSTSYWDLLYSMGLILTATKIWRLSLRLSPSSAFRLTASGETSSTLLHIASHQTKLLQQSKSSVTHIMEVNKYRSGMYQPKPKWKRDKN